MLDDNDKPTRRMTKLTNVPAASSPIPVIKSPIATYTLTRAPMLERTRDGFVIKVGDRSIEVTQREAVDLTVELIHRGR